MNKKVYNLVIKALKDPALVCEFQKEVSPALTRVECKKAHLSRSRLTVEAILPNDKFSTKDIAFGILTNSKFVSASDLADSSVEIGYISHSLMLYGLGYAKNESDPHPTVDYQVRGIVKYEFHNSIVFWESPEILTESPKKWNAMVKCLSHLLKKGLVTRASKVYGAGSDVVLGMVGELL